MTNLRAVCSNYYRTCSIPVLNFVNHKYKGNFRERAKLVVNEKEWGEITDIHAVWSSTNTHFTVGTWYKNIETFEIYPMLESGERCTSAHTTRNIIILDGKNHYYFAKPY